MYPRDGQHWPHPRLPARTGKLRATRHARPGVAEHGCQAPAWPTGRSQQSPRRESSPTRVYYACAPTCRGGVDAPIRGLSHAPMNRSYTWFPSSRIVFPVAKAPAYTPRVTTSPAIIDTITSAPEGVTGRE